MVGLRTIAIRFAWACKDTVSDFLDKNCPYLAAAIAFYALLSFFPLLLALTSAAGFVLGSRSLETQLARELGALIPISSTFITSTITGVISARAATGVASIVGLLLASTAVFGAIRKGVNAAWGIKKPRPFLQERVIDIALMMGAGLLLMVSLSATATLRFLRDIVGFLSPDSTVAMATMWSLGVSVVPVLLTFLTFLVLYWCLPNTRVTFWEAWPGAALATVAFEVSKNLFIWYVGHYSTYNLVYGPIGAMVALLTWVYVSAVVLLFGALITSRYAAYRAARAGNATAQTLDGLRAQVDSLTGK